MPEGSSIGMMQSTMDWLFSHTTRFIGAAIVRIQFGKGCILIRRGEPLAFYFTSGTKTLRGNAARDYFSNQRLIEFDLRKYTPEEFEQALSLLSGVHPAEEPDGGIAFPEPAQEGTVPEEAAVPEAMAAAGEAAAPEETAVPEAMAASEKAVPEGIVAGTQSSPPVPAPTPVSPPVQPQPVDREELRHLLTWPGVRAVSFFNDGLNLYAAGDLHLEGVVAIGEDAIRSVEAIGEIIRHGPFRQITIELPSGTIILTRYRDASLCILTASTVHLGQIRSILEDIENRLQYQ
ncbi:MAG: roadblock/LC7 domain-containing protein [Methanomicrobiales archaeon]|nr:roadblock/LC7 domain-containing protein [Methanomicrobiales archaeon]